MKIADYTLEPHDRAFLQWFVQPGEGRRSLKGLELHYGLNRKTVRKMLDMRPVHISSWRKAEKALAPHRIEYAQLCDDDRRRIEDRAEWERKTMDLIAICLPTLPLEKRLWIIQKAANPGLK